MANATTSYRGKDGRQWIDVTANKTFLTSESGWVQNILVDGLTLTAPAAATALAGYALILRNGGAAPTGAPVGAVADNSVGITLTMASGDGVTGAGFTAAVNKGAVNTKATSRIGDEMTLISGGANTALAYNVQEVRGTWARLA